MRAIGEQEKETGGEGGRGEKGGETAGKKEWERERKGIRLVREKRKREREREKGEQDWKERKRKERRIGNIKFPSHC